MFSLFYRLYFIVFWAVAGLFPLHLAGMEGQNSNPGPSSGNTTSQEIPALTSNLAQLQVTERQKEKAPRHSRLSIQHQKTVDIAPCEKKDAGLQAETTAEDSGTQVNNTRPSWSFFSESKQTSPQSRTKKALLGLTILRTVLNMDSSVR